MKPLFHPHTLPVAALAVLLNAPTASQADPAVDACVDAFVSSTLPESQPVKVRKINATRDSRYSHGTTRQVQLVARVSRTGARIAEATCTVDGNGRVVALNGAPPKSQIAATLGTIAAR